MGRSETFPSGVQETIHRGTITGVGRLVKEPRFVRELIDELRAIATEGRDVVAGLEQAQHQGLSQPPAASADDDVPPRLASAFSAHRSHHPVVIRYPRSPGAGGQPDPDLRMTCGSPCQSPKPDLRHVEEGGRVHV